MLIGLVCAGVRLRTAEGLREGRGEAADDRRSGKREACIEQRERERGIKGGEGRSGR